MKIKIKAPGIPYNQCLIGDCREVMKGMIAKGVKAQMCVTSPPYWNLRDYGTASWMSGDPECGHVERKARSDIEYLRQGRAEPPPIQYKEVCGKCGAVRSDSQLGIEKEPGQYIKNMVSGVFPLIFKLLKDDGVFWLNIGDTYQNKALCTIPWALATTASWLGWKLRRDVIWEKTNPMPESATDRPRTSHEYLFMLTKSDDYYFDFDALPKYAQKSVWRLPTNKYPEAHFATYPPELIAPCILSSSRPGDVVFDPFMGSGTTAKVAQELNRKWLGIDLSTEYIELQTKRIGTTLFK